VHRSRISSTRFPARRDSAWPPATPDSSDRRAQIAPEFHPRVDRPAARFARRTRMEHDCSAMASLMHRRMQVEFRWLGRRTGFTQHPAPSLHFMLVVAPSRSTARQTDLFVPKCDRPGRFGFEQQTAAFGEGARNRAIRRNRGQKITEPERSKHHQPRTGGRNRPDHEARSANRFSAIARATCNAARVRQFAHENAGMRIVVTGDAGCLGSHLARRHHAAHPGRHVDDVLRWARPQYQPARDTKLDRPEDVARAVVFALKRYCATQGNASGKRLPSAVSHAIRHRPCSRPRSPGSRERRKRRVSGALRQRGERCTRES
jgi:hypothetical protein